MSREFVTGRVWWRLIRNLNWPFLLVVLSLLLYGLFVLFSATSLSDHAAFYWQLGYILAGLVLATLVANLDYHIWRKLAYPFYLLSGLLLVAVLFIGTEVFGSQRWINFGPIPIQPSELAKIAVVLVLARELTDKTMQRGPLIRFLRVLVLTIVPVLLVYEQPDLGTSIVLVFIFFWMSFFARIRPLYLLSSLGVLLASTPLLWQFLHEYQRDRILVLFNPQVEPLGIGYNLRQSLITIGSGGFWGKGYLQGTQKQLQFLPVRHTDFIFAVLAEELGFLGVAALLTLYAFFFYFCLLVIQQAEDDFGALLVVGLASMWLCHIFINIGMTAGIMPVTGIWLPFFSYGGNNVLISLIGVGLIFSVSLHRHRFLFYPEA